MSIVALQYDDHYVAFGGDGVNTNPRDGAVGGFVSKLELMPEYETILGITGIGGLGVMMRWCIPRSVRTFDDLIAILPDIVALACRNLDAMGQLEATRKACVVAAGYSNEAEAYRAYRVITYPKQSINGADNVEVTLEPWVLHEMPKGVLWASCAPTQEACEAVQMDVAQEASVDTGVARMICAGRLSSGASVTDEYAGQFNAGGFCQIATMTNRALRSYLMHEWPEDVAGEPIDPERGDALPDHMMIGPEHDPGL